MPDRDDVNAKSSGRRFNSRRAYRRWLKRQGIDAHIHTDDIRHSLETLEQRMLLSAAPVFELSDLLGANGGNGTEGVVINGVSLGDRAGVSISSAGDINGDGFDDVIIGAFRAGPNGADSGGSYVVFGKAGGFSSSLQLSTINGSNGFKINGVAAGDFSGRSVAAAGDVNGDGFDDLMIGSFLASPNGAESGQVHVVYGKASAFNATLELSALNGSDGFSIDGVNAGDRLGFSVRGAGDVNADGIDDFILGASLSATNGADSGSAYLVFGQTGFGSSFDLSTLNGTNGFVINGVSADDQLGISVNAAGDVNGDGIGDVVVGAFLDDPNGAESGAAFVVFGKTTPFAATLNPATLNGSTGFIINGVSSADNAGRSVSSAGDFNGDGFADILIGANAADGSAAGSGSAYVVFGQAGPFASTINLSTLTGANGFKLNGIVAGDRAGLTVSSAGDVNGDGLDDLLVAADRANANGIRSGETYLVLGRSSAMPASINMSALSGADGFVLNGINAQDSSAVDVRDAGDVDGDGFGDFIIGAFLADPNGGESGESYLVFGGDFSDAVTHLGSAIQDALVGTGAGDVMVTGRGNDVATGNGGADVILTGHGDDQIEISDNTFSRIDGGTGTDTLVLDSDGINLDLTAINDSRLRNIEVIDISGGANTITLSLRDVLNISSSSNTLTVIGNNSITIDIGSGWTQTNSQIINGDEHITYTQGNATLITVIKPDNIDPVLTVDPIVTTVRSPELTGTVIDSDPATTVEITVDGNNYAATNNGDGTWTLAAGTISPDLADGVYEVVATGTDSSGNIGVDLPLQELIVDNGDPVVTIDALITNSASPQLTGTVTDLDPGTSVTVTVDGKGYAATNNGDGTWTLAAGTISPNLAEGDFEVAVSALDTNGHTGSDSTNLELTIDLTDPVVTINDPGVTDITSPELSGTLSDVNLTTTVRVFIDGSPFDATNNGDGTWTLPAGTITPALAEGTRVVNVEATDNAGNVGQLASTFDLIIDTAPIVTVNFLRTSDQRPELTGTIIDQDAATATVTVTVDGVAYPATNNGNGTWTLADNTVAVLTDGNYDVVASVDDGINIGTDTGTNDLIIDTTTPVVTVDMISTQDTSPRLSGNVSDLWATIEVTVNGMTYNAVNTRNGRWALVANTISPALAEGVYDVSVTATNLAEIPLMGTDSTTDELRIDTTAPTATVDTLSTTDRSPELTGTVSETDTSVISVTISGGGGGAATNNGDGTWTLADDVISPDLAPGTYDVTVTVVDTAGNNSGPLVTVGALTIEDAPFSITIDPLTTADTTPELTGEIIGDSTGVVVVVTVNGTPYAATNNGDGKWTLADDTIAPALAEGIYDISVTGTNADPFMASDSTTNELTIDTTAPVVTVDALSTQDTTPQLTGTIDDAAASISVTVDGTPYVATNNGDGTWTLADDTIAPALAEGVYDVTVTATNQAAIPLIGTDSTTDELRIDQTAPTPTVDSLTTSDRSPELTGTISEAVTSVLSVTISGGGGTFLATNNGDGTWTLPNDQISPDLAPGTYDVTVTAVDEAGNSSGPILSAGVLEILEFPFSITVDPLSTNDTRPQLTGQILGDPTGVVVVVTVDGTPYAANNNGDGTWTLPDDAIALALAPGVYDVSVSGTNAEPFNDTDDTTDELTIDLTAPVVTIDPLSTPDSTPALTGTVDDATAEVTVTINGNQFTATNNGDGTWILADNTINPALLNGTYDVLATATDPAGNAGVDATIDELIIATPPVSTIDLEDLLAANGGTGTQGVVYQGDSGNDRSGVSASSAGDINGDGFDDLIIGANETDFVSSNDGSAYIIFGQASGFPAELDLATLNGTNGFRIDALVGGDDLGVSVDSAGDVNGDGLDDLIIGASKADPNGNRSGSAFIVYGSTGPYAATLDLNTLNGTNGYRFDGETDSDRVGFSVSGAGDVNGDGLDDVVIGASGADDGVTLNTGRAYLIFGSTAAMPATMTVGALNGTNGFIITGVETGASTGFSVSGAGDMNGDGLADIRISASGETVGANSDAGRTYVIFGQATAFPTDFNLSTINGTNGFAVEGDVANLSQGFSGSAAGDFNGDGFDDLIVSTPSDFTPGSKGAAYVLFGKGSAFAASISIASLDGTNGFALLGADAGDDAGYNVSGVGDVNGDGFDDILIGARSASGNGPSLSGEAYLMFGRSGVFAASIDLDTLPGNGGVQFNGISQHDRAGRYVSGAGDVNGDGFDDLIIAARDANSFAGETYLVFGRDFTNTVTQVGAAAGEVFNGAAGRDAIVAGAGDDESVGNGGPDVLSSGQGDDIIAISDTGFVRINGGNGSDTLRLDGAGITLDLTTLGDSYLQGIEQIDLRGSGANTLTLDLQEVLNISDTSNTLLVLSDGDDTVNIGAGWTPAGTELIDGKTFDVFTQGNATLKVFTEGDIVDPVVTVDALNTTDATPQLTGTVVDDDPLTTVQVTVNGIQYAATNNGDGTWTLADDTITPALNDGTYDVSVLATDTAGNTGTDATTDELVIDTPLVGDLNGDGFVGIDDLTLVLGNWNQFIPPGDPLADPSGDGFVGIDDLSAVLGNWNAGTPPVAESSASTPEPQPVANVSEQPAASTQSATAATADPLAEKVSLLDEVSSTDSGSTSQAPTQTPSAWSWMQDADRTQRSAFMDADEDEADSALDLAMPDPDAISRL